MQVLTLAARTWAPAPEGATLSEVDASWQVLLDLIEDLERFLTLGYN